MATAKVMIYTVHYLQKHTINIHTLIELKLIHVYTFNLI